MRFDMLSNFQDGGHDVQPPLTAAYFIRTCLDKKMFNFYDYIYFSCKKLKVKGQDIYIPPLIQGHRNSSRLQCLVSTDQY